MNNLIYLDNHATTQLDPRVFGAMKPYFMEKYGNANSRSHSFGWEAEEAVDIARERVANLIGAQPEEIFFTSGATEANNIVLSNFNTFFVSAIEHSSVYEVCRSKLFDNEQCGKEIKVDGSGKVDFSHLERLLKIEEPEIISVMLANNEVGTIQPIEKIGGICKSSYIHSDMAQALGKISIDVKKLKVDFASFSAHKLYGPKGIGAIYIDRKHFDTITPLMHGGKQEGGIRPGTLNVPAIVGFGKACEIAAEEMEKECDRLKKLRDTFFNIFAERTNLLDFHGHKNSLPGSLNIPIPCKDMDLFMANVGNRVVFSFGAACNSTNNSSSRVLKAMGVSDETAKKSIRLCFGRFNTEEEAIKAANIICDAIDGG